MKVVTFLVVLALISCSNIQKKEVNSFDPVEFLRCVVNSPEVYQYIEQIVQLVIEGKTEEIQKVIIEALPAIVKKGVECAFPEKIQMRNEYTCLDTYHLCDCDANETNGNKYCCCSDY